MEILGLNASLFWFLLGVAFLVLEALTPGFFLMFFGLGAWATAALVFFLPLSAALQWAIFSVVSVLSLAVLRSRLKSIMASGKKEEMTDDPIFSEQYIGREVIVLKDVSIDEPGLVELNGTNWNAKTEGPEIKAGRRALVHRLEGLTLIINSDKPVK